MTAPTASRRTSNAIGGVPPRPLGRGARCASRAASQARTAAGSDERGQYDNEDRTSWTASDTCKGPVFAYLTQRFNRASRTPSMTLRLGAVGYTFTRSPDAADRWMASMT